MLQTLAGTLRCLLPQPTLLPLLHFPAHPPVWHPWSPQDGHPDWSESGGGPGWGLVRPELCTQNVTFEFGSALVVPSAMVFSCRIERWVLAAYEQRWVRGLPR